jgi:hypothetical protein
MEKIKNLTLTIQPHRIIRFLEFFIIASVQSKSLLSKKLIIFLAEYAI